MKSTSSQRMDLLQMVGAVPLLLRDQSLAGVLIVSGLAGPDDHRLAVAGIRSFIARKV